MTNEEFFKGASEGDFGMSCPILKIAMYFNADYTGCLTYADGLIHKRRWQEGVRVRKIPLGAIEAIEDHANKFKRLQKGLDS